jgi:hypothetical protein
MPLEHGVRVVCEGGRAGFVGLWRVRFHVVRQSIVGCKMSVGLIVAVDASGVILRSHLKIDVFMVTMMSA